MPSKKHWPEESWSVGKNVSLAIRSLKFVENEG